MILLVSMVTPPQAYLINRDEVENKIYQGVTNKTNKTNKVRLKINVKKTTLHRSFVLIIFSPLLPRLLQCYQVAKFHEVNYALT